MNDCSTSSIPVYREDGRVVGQIVDGSLCKRVKRSKHMLRRPQGWAWDDVCLKQADEVHAQQTKIEDEENDIVYIASLSIFRKYGISLNRKFGKQTCLPLKYWQVHKQGQNPPQQLSLF
jgi:hypothetical protein